MNQEQLTRANNIKMQLQNLNEEKRALSLIKSAFSRKAYFAIEGRHTENENYIRTTVFYDEEIIEVTRILLLNKVEAKIKELTEEFNKL